MTVLVERVVFMDINSNEMVETHDIDAIKFLPKKEEMYLTNKGDYMVQRVAHDYTAHQIVVGLSRLR